MGRYLLLLLLPFFLFACAGEDAAGETPLLEGPALVIWYTDN